jgi:hypothetical protein
MCVRESALWGREWGLGRGQKSGDTWRHAENQKMAPHLAPGYGTLSPRLPWRNPAHPPHRHPPSRAPQLLRSTSFQNDRPQSTSTHPCIAKDG